MQRATLASASNASLNRLVAGEPGDNDSQRTAASHEATECMPCRGSGQVISNLGGTPKRVTCPWCGGGGVRLADVDAQAKWLEQDPGAGSAPDGPPDAAS